MELQLGQWMAFNLVFVIVGLLGHQRIRHWLRDRLEPVTDRIAPRLGLRVVDNEPGVLWLAMHRRRLVAHIERLRRAVVTDEHMSATRQMGNRIALARLQHDLSLIPDLPVDLPSDPPPSTVEVPRWSPTPGRERSRERSWVPATISYRPAADPGLGWASMGGGRSVEVLDLAW